MTNRERSRYEMIKRASKFRTDNAGSFPSGPGPAEVKATELFGIVDTTKANVAAAIEGRAAAKATFHAGTTMETTQRDGLMRDLLEINRCAASIAAADGTPALMEFFRIPHGEPDSELPGKARAMKTKAASLSARFIELGFPNDFAAQLEARIVAFEAAGGGQDAALQQQTGFTGAIGALLEPGMAAVKQLDVICRQKFKSDAQKLGEWVAASHVERTAGSSVEVGGGSGGNQGGGGPTVPAKAQITNLTGNGTATVSFDLSAESANGFDLFAKLPGSNDFALIAENLTDSHYTWSNVAGSPYIVKAVGKNNQGAGPESDEVIFSGPV